MTSWPNETEAIKNMINTFGGENKIYACVLDSYDYSNCLNNIIPSLKEIKEKKGGTMVYRPDSGDPTECVLRKRIFFFLFSFFSKFYDYCEIIKRD